MMTTIPKEGVSTSEGASTGAFWRSDAGVLTGIVLVKVLFHFCMTGWYGYFRDEFYYIACSEHLDWGYVDHPPFSIWVLAGVRAVLGDSIFAIRLLPVLAGGFTVFLSGWIARELGGGRFAQVLTAVAVVVAPNFLGAATLFSMNAFEQVFWPLGIYILIRIIKTGDSRLWVWFGVVAGIGLLNKLSMTVFGTAVVAGLLLTEHRKYFLDKWLYIGGAAAGLIFLPHLIWQVVYDWPFLEFAASQQQGRADTPPLQFFLNQALTMHPFTLPIWLSGVGYLLMAKRVREYRILGIMFLVVYGVFMMGNGKDYYVAPMYPAVLAGGAMAIERLVNGLTWRWVRPAMVTVLLIGGGVIAPLAIPILPPERYGGYLKALGIPIPAYLARQETPMPQHLADRFGWENIVGAVGKTYHELPEEDQGRCEILAPNWGLAGAIDFFGKAHGLPNAICAQHTYWYWKPADAKADPVLAIGGRRESLEVYYEHVEERARVISKYAVENDVPIFLCRELKLDIDQTWAKIRDF